MGLGGVSNKMDPTPTPSEHGHSLDGQYDLAWNLWLMAHMGGVGKRNFNRLAAQLDGTPGAGEYFRWLCQYELWVLDGGCQYLFNI